MENPALTPKDNEMVLDTYIEYPQDMPANGLIDLENISEYQQKRDILKSDEEFENMIKREARDLDKKIWQVNGLVNPREYGALFTINEDRVINPQYDMRELNVELNKDLTNYEIMFTKLGSLSREEIDTVDVTPKMRFKEPETKTPQALSPVYEIKTPDTPATPAMQTIPSEQSMQPTSPVYAPTSPAFAPTSPPLAPTTPTTPTSMPSSPVYAPTSPELSQETQQGGGIVPANELPSGPTIITINTEVKKITNEPPKNPEISLLTDVQGENSETGDNSKNNNDDSGDSSETKKVIT